MARKNPSIEEAELDLNRYIIDGMADALWENAFLTWTDDTGQRIDLPDTPSAAYQAAEDLVRLITTVHKDRGDVPLVRLFEIAFEAHTGNVPGLDASVDAVDEGWPPPAESTIGDVAMTFGHYLAMMSMGTGISWFDDHKASKGRFDRATLALPDFETYYDGVYLTWSGGKDFSGQAVATVRHPGTARYLVVRVNGEDADTYAVDYDEGDDLTEEFDEAMELAVADQGSTIHYAIVFSPDGHAGARQVAMGDDETTWVRAWRVVEQVTEYDADGDVVESREPEDHWFVEMDTLLGYLQNEQPLTPSSAESLPGTFYTGRVEDTGTPGHTVEATYRLDNLSAAQRRIVFDAITHGPQQNPAPPFRSILMIEDEPHVAARETKLLTQLYPGASVTVVDNAADAMDAIDGNPDLIISDWDINGDHNGGWIFDHVKHHHPLLVDRFVFWSGNADAGDKHYRWIDKAESTRANVRDVIERPAPSGAGPRPKSNPSEAECPVCGKPLELDGKTVRRHGSIREHAVCSCGVQAWTGVVDGRRLIASFSSPKRLRVRKANPCRGGR